MNPVFRGAKVLTPELVFLQLLRVGETVPGENPVIIGDVYRESLGMITLLGPANFGIMFRTAIPRGHALDPFRVLLPELCQEEIDAGHEHHGVRRREIIDDVLAEILRGGQHSLAVDGIPKHQGDDEGDRDGDTYRMLFGILSDEGHDGVKLVHDSPC